MKKIFLVLAVILMSVVIIVTISITENSKKIETIRKTNHEYEIYLNKEVFGTDVTTIMNKATNNNIKNNIQKDEKGFYINDNEKTIKVEINMINEKEDKIETYQMETIQKVGISGFIKNFNLINFRCTKIEYHPNGQVKKIVFEQISN